MYYCIDLFGSVWLCNILFFWLCMVHKKFKQAGTELFQAQLKLISRLERPADTCQMASLQSFEGLTHPSDQDPSWEGSPHPKIDKNKCVLKWSTKKELCMIWVLWHLSYGLYTELGLTYPSDQDPSWEGSPHPKIDKNKCGLKWLSGKILP